MHDAESELDEHCQETWRAYAAMFESKQRHYEFLEILENKKKKFNLSPSEDDKEQLDGYLAEHDEKVKQFTHLSQVLKAEHPESHLMLFRFIGKLGDGVPSTETQH